jgi:7-cyano-7-deazaguanine synthase in queuosine biosynthesis
MHIHIPENIENINILMSGGADSTLLTFLLSKQTDKKIICHVLHANTQTQQIIENIIKYLTVNFNDRYVLNYFKNKKFLIREAVENILMIYPGVVYTGCNKVVYHIQPTVYIPGDTPPVRGPVANEYHIRPFIDLDKTEIIKIYKDEGLLDLLSITKSCGLPGYERCGGCYFCMERAWAIESNDIIDINKLL